MRLRTTWNILMMLHLTILYPGLILLFSGSVLDSYIVEKLVNGFSRNFQDMLDTAQPNNWSDCFTYD